MPHMAVKRKPDLQRALGEAVRAQREGLGLTQDALAARCKINRSYLGDLEAGNRNPSLDTLTRLARGLDIALSELLAEAESR